MAKNSAHEKNLRNLIVAVVAVLAVGFGGAWLYMQQKEKQTSAITYLKLPSVAISRDGYSMRATFAVRTSAADAEWASRNRLSLAQVMQKALQEADPMATRSPGGLKALQERVREVTNTTLQSQRIQEVLVTDFLVSEGDL